jgi:hypothetical protein
MADEEEKIQWAGIIAGFALGFAFGILVYQILLGLLLTNSLK